MNRLLPTSVLFFLCTSLCVVSAQTAPSAVSQQPSKTAPQVRETLPSYEGQPVTTVELAGQPEADLQKLRTMLSQRSGAPFSQAKVDESMAALKRKAGFQSVKLEIRPEAGGIRVLFVLEPAVYFGVYRFPGAERFPYSRLLQISDYPPRGAYTPVDVENARKSLERFFQRAGYFQAVVEPVVQTDRVHGLANVIFNTQLHRKAKFGEVKITGTTPEQTEHLRDSLTSVMARLKSSAIRPGKSYKLRTVQNATQYLENVLIKEKHLAAKVKLAGAHYDPETNRTDIEFNVQPGPEVAVEIQGAHLWPWTKKRLIPMYQQAGMDPELVQEGRQNLLSYFQGKGYFQAKVETNIQDTPAGQDVSYRITKGPRHKVEGVKVAGNDHIDEKELLSHVEVEKAHFLSHGKYSEKLVHSSVKNLERFYEANGFSSVQVRPQITNDRGDIVVTFHVNEGPQDIVSELRIEGNDTMSEAQLAPKGLKLAPGQAYSTKLVDEDRNQILAEYLRAGYLNATFRAQAAPTDGDKHQLAVVYKINEGPRVTTSSVILVGQQVTRPQLIAREVALPVAQPMRQDDMLASESRLYNLGVFDWAEIDPRRTITTQNREDVVVKVHEAKRNELNYGFGFEVINRGGSVPGGTVAVPGIPPVGLSKNFRTSESTFWGPRGVVEYTRRNIRGRAETLTVSGFAGRLDQRGSVAYQDPYFRGTNWTSTLSVSGEHDSQNPIFTARLAQLSYQLQRALNRDKTQNLFLRYSLKSSGLTRLLIPDLVPGQDQHVRLSTVSATYIRDTRDHVLDAHKGIYETVEFDLNPAFLGSNVSFAKLVAQTAYYKKTVADIVWANSLRLGLEQPIGDSHVPLSEKFFSGGGSTLRGFPLNGAGPQRSLAACGDPADASTCALITVPTGGNQLFIVNSELRVPVNFIKKNLSVVPFYDGGNVYQKIGFHDFGGQYTNTVGIGLRYATPVGPVRIDVGHNLNAPPGIKSTQIFVTLGQAF